MMKFIPGEKGFTLVEIIAVLAVITTLATLFGLNAQSAQLEAKATVCEKNRILCEDAEMVFWNHEKRHTTTLQELVDAGHVTRSTCPSGGHLTWAVVDESLPYSHQALVCSVHGPKTRIRAWESVPASPEHDFFDPFDGPVATGWNETVGRYFETGGGTYMLGSPRGRSGTHMTFSGSPGWTDYTLSADVALSRGKGFGLYFRTQGGRKPNGYVLVYNAKREKFVIQKVVNGRHRSIAKGTKVRDRPKVPFTSGTTKTVSIQVKGNQMTARVGDEIVFQGSDGTFERGGIGLRTWGSTQAVFDSVTVDR